MQYYFQIGSKASTFVQPVAQDCANDLRAKMMAQKLANLLSSEVTFSASNKMTDSQRLLPEVALPSLEYKNYTIRQQAKDGKFEWFDNDYEEGDVADTEEDAKKAVDQDIDNKNEAAYDRFVEDGENY